jgi:hypothetical protein
MKRETAEHRNAGAERKRGVGVAEIVGPADRFDAGGVLRGSPVTAAKDAEVDPAAASVREQDRVDRGWQPVERLNCLRLRRHRPRAQPRLSVLDPDVRERAPHVDDAKPAVDVVLPSPNSSEGRSPVAAPKITIGPYTGPSRAAIASICAQHSNGRFSFGRRCVFGTPRFAGLKSSTPQATARLRTCRSACVASKRCPSGTVRRHA